MDDHPRLFDPPEEVVVVPVRNEIWDGLVAVFGEPTTKSNQKLRGKVCASLTRAGATFEEILARASAWPFHFPGATLTETALEKHWDRLGRPPLRATAEQVRRAENVIDLDEVRRRLGE